LVHCRKYILFFFCFSLFLNKKRNQLLHNVDRFCSAIPAGRLASFWLNTVFPLPRFHEGCQMKIARRVFIFFPISLKFGTVYGNIQSYVCSQSYRTPDILRPFLFFFIFFSSFTYERKREKGAKYWGYGRHRSIPSVKLNWEHREPFACSRNFQAWLYNYKYCEKEKINVHWLIL
jgi:hypothetical protein